jgi:hypothetical protein
MHNSIIDIQISEGTVSEPVTLAQVKAQCIVDHSLDDTVLNDLTKQCRQEIESICGISIVEKGIVLIADWKMEQQLPYPPIKAINEIKVKTGNSANGATEYDTPRCYSIDGGLFDMGGCQRLKITYTTGMATVTDELKKALLNLIAFRYENRGDHDKDPSDDLMTQILRFKDFSWV